MDSLRLASDSRRSSFATSAQRASDSDTAGRARTGSKPLRNLIRLRTAKPEKCQQDDIDIEPERPVLDVIQVVLDAHLHLPRLVGLAAPAAHLRPARDARLDPAPQHVGGYLVEIELVQPEGVRPWPDDGHVAQE